MAVFRRFVAFCTAIRAYSTPLVFLILLNGVFVADLPFNQGIIQAVILVAGILLIQIGSVIVNDKMHQDADTLGKRGRNIDQFIRQSRLILYLLPILAILILIVIYKTINFRAVWLLLLFAASTILYGWLKGRGVWSIAGRGVTALLMAGLIPMANQIVTRQILLFICFAALLDAAGNLVGDIRDIYVDNLSNTQTMVVRYDKFVIITFLLICHLLLLFLWMELALSGISLLIGAIIIGILTILIIAAAHFYSHFFYLIAKYLLHGVALAALSGNASAAFLLTGFFILFAGIIYRAKHFQPEQMPPHATTPYFRLPFSPNLATTPTEPR